MEDLNFGFKRGRFKVEKQVYQKFEKAVIDKLNYLVFKDAKLGTPGHYLNAYQLTSKFESFEKLGKQTGVLFYVGAAYTSKIDPNTGFVSFLKTAYESCSKSKLFFEGFDSIVWNAKEGYFEFHIDYAAQCPDRKLGSYPKKWVVCTHGELRYKNQRNSHGVFESIPINVSEELRSHFDKAGIQYEEGQELKIQLAELKKSNVYKKIHRLIGLTLSLRHSKSGTEEDFILSPVANEAGEFFDSRKAQKEQPQDADANGAYHIALKGLWNLQQIEKTDWSQEKPKVNLAMKNETWFSFASTHAKQRQG